MIKDTSLASTHCFNLVAYTRQHRRLHEFADIAVQRGDFPDHGGRDEHVLVGRRQEHRFDIRAQHPVHAGHLELVFEVRHRSQPTHDDARIALVQEIHQQAGKAAHLDIGVGGQYLARHVDPLIGREEGPLGPAFRYADDAAIVRWRAAGGKGRPWLSVESLYSMDGDSPDIAGLFAVADRHEAMVVIDEAHATGVLGPQGRGLAAPFEGRDNVITLHTCGKALGTVGGFILAPRTIRDFLVNRARPFIFATAPSPLTAAITRSALEISRTNPERRERLAGLVRFAGDELRRRCSIAPSGSQIIPIVIGADRAAVAVAASLQQRGFDIRAIRPPTVPEGTARLRIALTLNVDESVVAKLFEALAEDMRKAA